MNNNDGGNDSPSKAANGKLNWPTLVLILITGGGNFFATQKDSAETRYEQEQALKQIAELHASLDDFEGRQKEELSRMQDPLKNQSTMLQNQHDMLSQLKNR